MDSENMFLLNDNLPLQIGNLYNFQLYHLHYQTQKASNSALVSQGVKTSEWQYEFLLELLSQNSSNDQSLSICPKNPRKKTLVREHYIS